jgi:hypothetical protein
MNHARPIHFVLIGILAVGLSTPVTAADANVESAPEVHLVASTNAPQISVPVPRARMSADLALQVHENRLLLQNYHLGEYHDLTTIQADLPEAQKTGRFRVVRMFSAPKSLAFKAVDFVGDGFVKTNVIARLLQSEVEHVQKGEDASTAITRANYKFSYKGLDDIAGTPVHVFQVKPRHKIAGLFKGKVYLNVYSGAIVRAEGKMVRSPSFFVKNIEFTQDYEPVGEFNFVSHVHSTADTRLVGKVSVDVSHSDYQAKSTEVQTSAVSVQPLTSSGK